VLLHYVAYSNDRCAAFNHGNFLTLLKIVSHYSVEDKRKSVNIFELEQMLKMSSTRLHVLSQPLSKTRDSLVLRKIFPCLLAVRLLIQKLYFASDETFKKPSCIAPHNICMGFKFGELGGHYPLPLLN